MTDLEPQTDDEGRPDRGRPWITVLVVMIVAIAAAVLFRQLHQSSTSPQAAGSSDPVIIAAHKGADAR